MEDMIFYDRLQFAFTITFHYIFPQLTMGLSLMIVYFKWRYLRNRIEKYNNAAKFFMKIFAINFTMGVITGIPMEFQFGTNWAKFSELTGDIIGQTLAMEGLFSFVLESSFLALFIFGEKLMGQKLHFLTGFLVFLGSWASAWFILATNAWMQHPVGYEILDNGKFVLENFSSLFTNPWLLPAFLHNQMASVITSAFVMAAIGAFYILRDKHSEYGRLFLRTGVVFGFVSSILVAFPTGDWNSKNVAKYQPATFAAMEGIFETEDAGAEIVLIGQPNMVEKKLDNKIAVPNVLSFLTYQEWNKQIVGMDQFEEDELPDNIPALYYSYHIMVGLGTIFIGVMALALFFLWRKKLYHIKSLLWTIMFLVPFPYIANITGWYTAELGRQPYLVYGLLRTSDGISPTVSSGNTLFTLLGFVGLYMLLGLLFLVLVGKTINQGPTSQKRLIMELFWYIAIGIVLIVFFILDGYDFGTGIIHLFFAKKEKDKEVITKSAGLFWDSNEVWLVAAGGLLFMAFPTFYASVFSGFYLPLIIVLWLIIFRAIGLEFRGQFRNQMWKDIWDKSFGVSSLLLALFFGIALGNIVRGVNLGIVDNGIAAHEGHYFFLPLWDSSFSPLTDHPGVIDWFTILIGFISVVTLTIHGANWVILKTNSSINNKLKSVIFKLNIVLAALTVSSLIVWKKINPESLDNFGHNPYLLVFPVIYLTGLIGLFFIKKIKKNSLAFLLSTLLILGGISSSLASMFPVILPSTNDIHEHLTIYNTAASEYGLSVAFIWGIIGFILIIVYAIVQNKIKGGKVDDMDYGH